MLMVTIAMVTKVSARNHGGEVRLKAAASFAESGDIRDVVEELWKGPGAKKQTLIDTVRHPRSHESLFVCIE
jgi:Xaa-Pro aminopeptidase